MTELLEHSFVRMSDRMRAAPNQMVEHLPGPNPSNRPNRLEGSMKPTRACVYPGCADAASPKAGGGMCTVHYYKVRRDGEEWPRGRSREARPVIPFPMSEMALSRFMGKVTIVNGCWIWTAYRTRGGYGMFNLDKVRLAHRISYMHHVRVIDESVHLDHLCRNRACVNPEHLEEVTPRENWERGYGPARINAAKTHCVRGHEFTPENTIPNGENGRGCRACMNRIEPCGVCGAEMYRGNLARHRRAKHGGSDAAA